MATASYWQGRIHQRTQHAGARTIAQPNLNRLRLLSYNIQVAIPGESLRKFVTGGWRHILPHATRLENLTDIANLVKDFDIVALQEVDAGSLRSNYVNQIEYLAHTAGFPYWYWQLNRSLGRFAQQCNGALSRFYAHSVDGHRLPGLIPGRGAIMMQFGKPENPLIIVAMHLSLTRRSRNQQLAYIADLVNNNQHVILVGDMNCPTHDLITNSPLKDTDLKPVNEGHYTFPSWAPSRNIDHFFISPSLKANKVEVYNQPYSDHLPIALELTLPKGLEL